MTQRQQTKIVVQGSKSERLTSEQLREQIEQLAYTLYCQCGHEHGHDREHWVEAERLVLEQHQEKSKAQS